MRKSTSLLHRAVKGLAESRLAVVEQTTVSCPENLLHDGRDLQQGVWCSAGPLNWVSKQEPKCWASVGCGLFHP